MPLVVSAILLIPASLAPAQQPAPTEGVVRLHLESRVHMGDDPRCAEVVDPECVWQAPPKGGLPRGIVWKRGEVTLPEEMRRLPGLALLVQNTGSGYEVFANGHLIGSSGSMRWAGAGIFSRRILELPAALAPNGRLKIAIRVNPMMGSGGMTGFDLAIASPDRIRAVMDADTLAYLQFNSTHYLCFAAVGGAALVFWLLFSVNTQLWEFLWLGAMSLAPSLLRVVEVSTVIDLGVPGWFNTTLWALGNSLTPWFMIEFVFSFLKRPVPKVFRLVQLAGLVDFYRMTPFPAPGVLGFVVDHGTTTSILIASLSMLLILPACFRSKLPEMRWIGAAVLFFSLENAARMVGQLGLPSVSQDVIWNGLDIDLRGASFVLFAAVMLIAMTFRLRRIQDRNRQVEQEIAAARSVQQVLIPDELPSVPGLTVESAYLPAQEVGGDFFQVLPLGRDGESAFIVLGDVSGKGLRAAMTVSLIVGTLRTYAEFYSSPADLLAGLNRRLHGRGDGFATCLALLITPSGQVTLANAAHPNPYLDGVEVLSDNDLPLGLSLEVAYSERSFQLEPGQRLTLVTDGVVEATSAATRELFGFERTQAVSGKTAAEIAEAARSFGLGAPQADDITVLTIARAGARQSQFEAAIA